MSNEILLEYQEVTVRLSGAERWRDILALLELLDRLHGNIRQTEPQYRFSVITRFARRVQAALSKATETRRPNGFKISCKVASVGLPRLDRILYRLGRFRPTCPARSPTPPVASTSNKNE